MMKCSLLLFLALIVSADRGTHSAPIADRPVTVATRSLYPSTQPDVDGKRMLRVTYTTSGVAGEERAPVGVEEVEKLEPLGKLLLHKTTGDHKLGILESYYSSVADWFARWFMKPGETLTMSKNRPLEEVEAAEDPVAKGVDDSATIRDLVDRSDVKARSSPEDLKRAQSLAERLRHENFLVQSGLRQINLHGM